MKAKVKLNSLLEQKKNNVQSEQDKEKIEVIEELFKDNNCFFNIRFEVAIGIMEFLGVKQDECLEMYKELVSAENFVNIYPQQRFYMGPK